ncbi:hypothetical protein ETD86_40975 [Nonomuraea turkmeniaca]|uniref:Uncharacterized protein n=1 Tax=Nonomuraea turkmeniaca TaxID=103838 RepID=A0A5S4F1Y6_9ACTN|nr:hypothetical protein [Nonomuraea turkmeniaca]TMR10101.1 hypothetical protein ETD86_40975 [Nonomuraea turkmeniaca]
MNRSSTQPGCVLVIDQLIRLLAAVALIWSALTTISSPLAFLSWALASVYVLAVILGPLARLTGGSR